MNKRLRKIFYSFMAPAVFGLAVICLIKHLYGSYQLSEQTVAIIAPIIFILAAVFGIAGPIFYRSLFAHHYQHLSGVPQMEMFKFERNLILMALVTPYLALSAYFLQLPRFHLAGTILVVLYAVYYYYPSHKRMRFDHQIFRTGNKLSGERTRL
jgi:Ca2+/Na+ antiporter